MTPADWAFVGFAVSPLGGLLVAIPFATFELHYPPWLTLVAGVPLAYVQVIAVDALWLALSQLAWWTRILERRRSARVERLLAARGGFWITFLATPFLGPWLVMAFMRYAHVPHRRVGPPILLALVGTSALLIALCTFVPRLFRGAASG